MKTLPRARSHSLTQDAKPQRKKPKPAAKKPLSVIPEAILVGNDNLFAKSLAHKSI